MDEKINRPPQLLTRNVSDHLETYPIQRHRSVGSSIQAHRSVISPIQIRNSVDEGSDSAGRSDAEMRQWIGKRWSAHRWFHLTVRFNMFNLHRPMKTLCDHIYDNYVHYKVRKLIGVSFRPITFAHEYELAIDGGRFIHHIHAVIGVIKSARIDRLVRNVGQALIGGGKSRIHGVQLDELPTQADMERAYAYIRKDNRHKDPFA
jgi:hypothetical protein